MEKVVRIFHSFEEAEKADREMYRNMTPQERLDMVVELGDRLRKGAGEDPERLVRVYRVVKLYRG